MPTYVPYGTFSPQTKITVGTTAVQLPTVSAREVWITTDDANSGKLFIGDSTVTNTGGGKVFTKIGAGQGVVMQLTQSNLVWVVGSAAGQVVYVGVLDA